MDEEHFERFAQDLAGRYRIERELGHGGMAFVYLAHDLKHDRPVALKVLRPDLAATVGPTRFLREIEVTAQLQHPNILQLLDSGEAAGLPFYVMRHVAGGSVADMLTREIQLPIEHAVRIACEVADAISYAHDHGVVHRDVKPDNIMLEGGHAIVADFGICRALDAAGGDSITSTGIALGTVGYMSPEQAVGQRQLDGRSDIYSVGCVLYQMLTGDRPFTGSTPQAVLARQSGDAVPSIRVVRETVAPELERAILKALAKAPADRFATAREFKETLERIGPYQPELTSPARNWVGITVAMAAAIGLGAWGLPKLLGGGAALDPNRVVVYPLVNAGSGSDRALGENVATMIGHALDGTGPLRWIDGWSLLDDGLRDSVRKLTLDRARSIAREQHSAYFVVGRVAARADSADVFLELHDVRGDSSRAKARASGTPGDEWRLGLRAVNSFLPVLIPTSTPEPPSHWEDRSPSAVASFLLGEAAFRRARFEEAMSHFANAVAADSALALAAIRGSEAAGWGHYTFDAQSFIQAALTRSADLLPRQVAFALGYQRFLAGDTEGAVAELERAIGLDPDMAIAWSELGEVYAHLLPREGRPDSLAEAALVEAYRLDSTAAYQLFHLADIAFRKGEIERGSRMAERLIALGPDTSLTVRLTLTRRCIVDGTRAVDWDRAGRQSPLPLLSAAKALAAGGAHLPCAERAYRAVLAADTATDARGAGRRFSALLGLQSLLLARGAGEEAVALIDSASAAGTASAGALSVLASAVGFTAFDEAAQRETRLDAERYGDDYLRCPFATRLWVLAIWEASRGRSETVAGIAGELRRRAQASGDRRLELTADALAVHAALARADTTEALGRLGALVPTAPPDTMTWHLIEPLGLERLLYARLLLARGDARGALAVADVLDSAEPLVYALYLRAGLEVRRSASEALKRTDLTHAFEQRLAALQRRQP